MDRQRLLAACERMLLIRRFEEAVIRVGEEFPGHRHVSIGQEGVAVAVAWARRDGDPVFSTHRNHGHNLALGADPGRLLAEFYGRSGGYCRGKGGSFHAAAADCGLLAASAVVAGSLPLAVGAGFGLRQLGGDGVAICCFGDGATNEGGFHEAVNLAALWRLPVLLVCEDNSQGDLRRSIGLAAADFEHLAAGYDLPCERVEGHDFVAVHAAVERGLARARGGGGPTLIVAAEVRWPGSGGAWPHLPAGETELLHGPAEPATMAAWDAFDPLRCLIERMLRAGEATAADLGAADARVRAAVERAVAQARSSPEPEPGELFEDVFAPGGAPVGGAGGR